MDLKTIQEEGIIRFKELAAIKSRFNPKEPIYAGENQMDLLMLEKFINKSVEKAFKAGELSGIRKAEECLPPHPTDTYAMNGGMFITRDKDDVDMYIEMAITSINTLKEGLK